MPSTRFRKRQQGAEEWLCFRVFLSEVVTSQMDEHLWMYDQVRRLRRNQRKKTHWDIMFIFGVHTQARVFWNPENITICHWAHQQTQKSWPESVVWLVCSLLVAIFLTDLNVYQSRALGFFLDKCLYHLFAFHVNFSESNH